MVFNNTIGFIVDWWNVPACTQKGNSSNFLCYSPPSWVKIDKKP
jgi:hypothetical protein